MHLPRVTVPTRVEELLIYDGDSGRHVGTIWKDGRGDWRLDFKEPSHHLGLPWRVPCDTLAEAMGKAEDYCEDIYYRVRLDP